MTIDTRPHPGGRAPRGGAPLSAETLSGLVVAPHQSPSDLYDALHLRLRGLKGMLYTLADVAGKELERTCELSVYDCSLRLEEIEALTDALFDALTKGEAQP